MNDNTYVSRLDLIASWLEVTKLAPETKRVAFEELCEWSRIEPAERVAIWKGGDTMDNEVISGNALLDWIDGLD